MKKNNYNLLGGGKEPHKSHALISK